MPSLSEFIKQRRVAASKADVDVAKEVGISIHEYCDIEQHEEELTELVSISTVMRILSSLKIGKREFIQLLGCDPESFICGTPSQILISAINKTNYSPSDVAIAVGYDEETIVNLKDKEGFGRQLNISVVRDIEDYVKITPGCLVISIMNEGSCHHL